jgi:hypothetical protein
MEPGHRHAAPGQTPESPFAALHIALCEETAGMHLADHQLTRCASSRCRRGGDSAVETLGPTPCLSAKDLKHAVNWRFAGRDPCRDHLAKNQGIVLQVDAIPRT